MASATGDAMGDAAEAAGEMAEDAMDAAGDMAENAKDAVGDMADDVFWHHVNEAKNDFACWIDDSIKDKELAKEMHNIKNKIESEIVILRHIVSKI